MTNSEAQKVLDKFPKELVDVATKVTQNLHKKNKLYTFDPLTILAILGVLLSLVQIWQNCNKKPAAMLRFKQKRLSFAERLLIRYVVNRHTDMNPADVIDAVNEILDILSKEEIDKVLQEIKSRGLENEQA